MARGTVLSLHRFPVKSMAGEPVGSLALTEHGAEGDRKHAVWLRGGRKLTARVAPKMLAWHATLNGALTVTAPDGREFAWDKDLERAVSDYLGKEVALVQDPQGLADEAPLHITVEASRRRLEDELGTPLDLRRFRPNVHVELDAEPFAESAWEGRRIRIGGVEIEIVSPTDRCAITIRDPDTLESSPEVLKTLNDRHASLFGVWARALGSGEISVGDEVELL